MADEVKLPAELEQLLEELKRLEKKKAEAIIIGGQGLGNAIDNQIAMLKESIGAALVVEAEKEAADAAGLAMKIADGQILVAPGEDQKRIKDAEDEIQRIKDKLKKADELFEGDIPPNWRDDVRRIEDDIPEMVEELGKAAIAAAAREVKDLKQEIDDLRKGKKKDTGSNKGPGPKDDDKANGVGTTDGGSGSNRSNVDSIGDGGTHKEPDPLTIFVRSETSVWAWARRSQSWVEQAFQTPIQEVKMISGGLLVIATEEAALFDTAIGSWLTMLNTNPEALVEGDSAG